MLDFDFNTRVEFFIGLTDRNGLTYEVEHTLSNIVSPLLVNNGIDGFTAVRGAGYWKGVREDALIVTYFTLGCEKKTALDIARRVARLLNQEAVLVNFSPAGGYLVGAA